jgi:hypothetical protein
MKRYSVWLILALSIVSVGSSEAAAPPTFIFVNNASTTLAAPAASGTTTMTLTSPTNFPSLIPAGTVMPLTLNDAATRLVYEIVYVTSISGSTLTVQRGQENTTPQNWSAGDFAFVGLTANVESGLAYGNGQAFANDTGSANAYSVTFQPAMTSHITGLPLYWKAANSNTASSTFNDGAGSVSLVNGDGSATQANQILAGGIYESVFNGTSEQLITPTTSSRIGNGAVTFNTTGSTNVTLIPFNGNGIIISGVGYSVPSGGVSATTTSCFINGVASQSLSASTLYYIYLFNNSGTLALDFSTTTHATDTTAGNVGVEIKSGDSSRTLVGMAFTDSSSHINDTTGLRNLRNWFDRRGKDFTGTFSGTTTATSLTQLSSAAAAVAEMCIWSKERVLASIAGSVNINASGAVAQVSVGVDGAVVGIGSTSTSAASTQNNPAVADYASTALSEGHHTLSMFGLVQSPQTATYAISMYGGIN